MAAAVTARHLAVVLERRLPIDFDTLSDEPEGYRDDGLGAGPGADRSDPHRERRGSTSCSIG